MAVEPHEYRLGLIWEGNQGSGTSHYAGYSRSFRVLADDKVDLLGSADPAFRGDASLHNPEELLVAALAACHMLFYLSLCARSGITVVRYSDTPHGEVALRPAGGGSFTEVTLSPRVTVSRQGDLATAAELHERARELCFIANSVGFPVHHRAAIDVERDAEPSPDGNSERRSGDDR